ncbi:MAG: 4Fe-4S ferredoxin, iron-sulfur binding domain protein [Anaerocolumna sp.]|nr:4Fe-4S ferredoxin, iron-sulfur binding domain protein [Anaerocolumna sp.]
MLLGMDIQSKLSEFIENDRRNSLEAHNHIKMYEEPLIGIASAEDELFTEFKKEGIVGPDFLTPYEWLETAKSVVVYFLPFTKEIIDSNRSAGLPSEEHFKQPLF